MLTDEARKPYTVQSYTKGDLPKGFPLKGDALRAVLAEEISATVTMLVAKLRDLRKRAEATRKLRAIYASSPSSPGDVVIFLEAEPADGDRRSMIYSKLISKMKVIPQSNLGYISTAQIGGPIGLGPKAFIPDCDGMILLHRRADDAIELRILKASRDRQELLASPDRKQRLLLGVLSEVPGPVPSASVFGIPVIEDADILPDGLQ
jgi:hypothetical protein